MAPSLVPFDPDPRQAEALSDPGPLLVCGAAGTGKTAVLRERLARLVEGGADPERAALVVRTRPARDAARTAVLRRLARSLPGLRVFTVHGLANHVLGRRFAALGLGEPPRILTAQQQFETVAELLEGESADDWPAYGAMLRSRGFADQVRQFLSRAQEALRSPADVRAGAVAAERPGFLELAAFYERYLDVVDERNVVDFPGLVRLAAGAAERAGDLEPLFDHLLVDDYQDATFATEALIARLAAPGLVLAGDLGSHILSFQGTTDVPLRRAADTFSGIRRVDLETPHRSAGREVRLEAWRVVHPTEEHVAVARELRRVHVEEGVPWRALGVVVRRSADELASLVRALDDAGVPRATPERGVWLLAEPAVRPFVVALRWMALPGERDGLVESLLTSELAGLSPAAARSLVRAALEAGRRPAEALDLAPASASLTEDERGAVRALAAALAVGERVAGRSVLDAFRVLWPGLAYARRLVERAERGPRGRRDLDAVVAFAEAVAAAGEGGDASVAGFLESLEASGEGPGLDLEPEGDDVVRVLTAHGAAGLEFDTVAVVGAVEGNFPSLARPEPMFDLSLLEERLTQSQVNRRRLEDERRLFDVVCSRASRRVLCTAADPPDGQDAADLRSRFVGERAVAWTPAPDASGSEPVTVAEDESRWRRTLADPARPPSDRLAALAGILALGTDPSRWWYQREWSAPDPDPEGDAEPAPSRPLRVSYSRLSTFENCHLQYALAHELGLEGPSGYQAWAGTLVHTLIEDVEAGTVERSLDAMLVEVERRWEPDRFPSRAVSETFKRLVRTKMLPTWMREYGDAPALAREQEFTFEFDGASVHGFIDRVASVQSGGCQITDYKTGSGGNEKAEESLQLGIYYLGIEESPELRERFGPVRAVELVFLRERPGARRFKVQKSLTSRSSVEYREQVAERLSGLLAELRETRQSGIFRPSPTADCQWCPFRTLCSRWPEGKPVIVAARPSEAPLPDPTGTEVVA